MERDVLNAICRRWPAYTLESALEADARVIGILMDEGVLIGAGDA
jgi:hypothetical protein